METDVNDKMHQIAQSTETALEHKGGVNFNHDPSVTRFVSGI